MWGAVLTREVVGKIEGEPTVFGFTLKVSGRIGVNDFVEVKHEGKTYVLIVKNVKRSGDSIYAECEVLGYFPKTPFEIGVQVYLASEDSIRRALGLDVDVEKSIYLGLLKGYPYKVYLPIKKINRIFVVGKPGSGKSYTVGVLIEEFLKKGVPLIVVDVHGEYSSLKIPAEKPCPEFGVTPANYADKIIEFADLNVNPGADVDINYLSKLTPQELVLTGQCVIINLRGLSHEEQISIVAELASQLLEAAIRGEVKPFYLILDEAHRFAGREKSKSALILRKFSQEGRKFGANLIVVTQRPQLLDMTVRSLSGTWIIHRLTDPNDVKIAIESGGLSKAWEKDINWLEPGEAVITGEAVERIPIIVKIRCRETRHGAPGFNPLDFVSQEELERSRKRIKVALERFKEVSVVERIRKPRIPPLIQQFYVDVVFDDKAMLKTLRELMPYSFSFNSVRLMYAPALLTKAIIRVERKRPNLVYEFELVSFTPISNEVKEIDWSSKSAYGVSVDEIEKCKLNSKAMLNCSYMEVISELKSVGGIEDLKESFIKYSTMASATSLLYHPAFNLTSTSNESLDEFKLRIEEEFSKRLREASKKVKDKYRLEIQRHEAQLKALKDELAITAQVAKDLIKEIEMLKKKRARLLREDKPALRISNQIRSRELKLARINRRLSELSIKIKGESEAVKNLKEEMSRELRAIKEELLNLKNQQVRSIMVVPKKDEVQVQDVKLIWIPIYKAELAVANPHVENKIGIEWNGLNGKGFFGNCIQCGEAITELNSSWLCTLCLNPVCSQHASRCEKCNSVVCPEHSWTCSYCSSVLCTNEGQYYCEICGVLLCEDCAKHCVKCGLDVSYCPNHIIVCEECGLPYCEAHFKEHLAKCAGCGREICKLALIKCDICNRLFCPSCIVQCSECGANICVDHSWKCDVCGRIFCANEESYSCTICGKVLCKDDAYTCPACGRTVCSDHVVECPNCGRKVCASCLVTVKKFFRTKRGCKLCLKP